MEGERRTLSDEIRELVNSNASIDENFLAALATRCTQPQESQHVQDTMEQVISSFHRGRVKREDFVMFFINILRDFPLPLPSEEFGTRMKRETLLTNLSNQVVTTITLRQGKPTIEGAGLAGAQGPEQSNEDIAVSLCRSLVDLFRANHHLPLIKRATILHVLASSLREKMIPSPFSVEDVYDLAAYLDDVMTDMSDFSVATICRTRVLLEPLFIVVVDSKDLRAGLEKNGSLFPAWSLPVWYPPFESVRDRAYLFKTFCKRCEEFTLVEDVNRAKQMNISVHHAQEMQLFVQEWVAYKAVHTRRKRKNKV